MKITELTAENIRDFIGQTGKTVFLDFYARWCAPCKSLSPIIDELAASTPDDKALGKVDIDEHRELTREMKVMSVPTLLALKDGKETARMTGLRDRAELTDFFTNY